MRIHRRISVGKSNLNIFVDVLLLKELLNNACTGMYSKSTYLMVQLFEFLASIDPPQTQGMSCGGIVRNILQ